MRVHLLHGSHKRKSREHISSQERQFIHERRRAYRRRVHEFEMRTTAMHDEQRRDINNQATELRMLENKAVSTLQILELELQQQFLELSSRIYDYENSRGSQLRLLAALRDQEQVHQAELSHTKREIWI